ncbi:MAG: GldG family protein [Clostridia bacterium]|nr:GldG family protein [Clostridia bacterium]
MSNNAFINKKSLKYGSLSLVLVALVLAVALVVNLIIGDLIEKGKINLKWDLTTNKMYSLGDTSKEILNKLNKDVTIYGLFDDAANIPSDYKDVVEFLKQYATYPHIKVEYINLDKNPSFVKEVDPQNTQNITKGEFIVKSGKKFKKLGYDHLVGNGGQQGEQKFSFAESSISGAIKFVAADKTPTVLFLEGHGEAQLDKDYTYLKSVLESMNYEVKSLNLSSEEKVSSDAEAVFVVSPKSDLKAAEAQKLNDYFKNGGKAVFLFDALMPDQKLSNFEEVLKNYNIALNYDVVNEIADRRFSKNESDIMVALEQNQINNPANNFAIYMPRSRSLNVLKNQKQFLTVTSLIKTSKDAVGVQIDKSRGNDNKGPLDLAVAAEYTGGMVPSRVVVAGNALFISDAAIQYFGEPGMRFVLDSMKWAFNKKDDLTIMPKSYNLPRLTLDDQAARLYSIVLIFVLPILLLGSGMFVWLRRRHL